MIFIAVVAFAACMLCYDIGRQHGERATMAAIRETIPNLGMYIQIVGRAKRPRVGDEITVNGGTRSPRLRSSPQRQRRTATR